MSRVKKVAEEMKQSKGEIPVREPIGFPTGLTLLDCLLGGDTHLGHRDGDIIRILGEKSTGKTFVLMETIAACYHKFGDKFKWKIDCIEGGFSFWNAFELWGLPVSYDNVITSTTPRESYHACMSFYDSLAEDEFGIFGMDSLDGFLGEQQLERLAAEKAVLDGGDKKIPGELRAEVASYMSKTYFPAISKILNSTNPKHKNALFIFISQFRDNPDARFGGRKASGGNAAEFYPDTIIELNRKQDLTLKDSVFSDELVVGGVVRTVLKKVRNPAPDRHIYYSFWNRHGLLEIETCIDYLYHLRSDTGRESAWGSCVGGELRAKVNWEDQEMTRAALIKLAEEDPNVLRKLQQKTIETWRRVEESVSPKRRGKYAIKTDTSV